MMTNYVYKRYKRSKTVRITIQPTRRVLITAPPWMPQFVIDRYVKKKEGWIQKHLDALPKTVNTDIATQSLRHYKKYREQARELIQKKVEHWNRYYQFSYRRITIKNNKTNWGSCSAKGNLNFNYKILFLPEHLQDYIIVHELCHLKELNHSQRFWKLVAETIPHHKLCRKQIRAEHFSEPQLDDEKATLSE